MEKSISPIFGFLCLNTKPSRPPGARLDKKSFSDKNRQTFAQTIGYRPGLF
jgi:hypothetical protein